MTEVTHWISITIGCQVSNGKIDVGRVHARRNGRRIATTIINTVNRHSRYELIASSVHPVGKNDFAVGTEVTTIPSVGVVLSGG